jgi:hypothetical protein
LLEDEVCTRASNPTNAKLPKNCVRSAFSALPSVSIHGQTLLTRWNGLRESPKTKGIIMQNGNTVMTVLLVGALLTAQLREGATTQPHTLEESYPTQTVYLMTMPCSGSFTTLWADNHSGNGTGH